MNPAAPLGQALMVGAAIALVGAAALIGYATFTENAAAGLAGAALGVVGVAFFLFLAHNSGFP